MKKSTNPKSKARRGLGRGLDALLKSAPPAPGASPGAGPPSSAAPGYPMSLPVESLEPNRFQPRSDFDESGLDDLASSIKSQGIVQPIVVTPQESAEGLYTIVAGERRWRAAQRAGLQEVPVVVRKVADDRQLLEMALVENLQRADLNPIEEAEAYQTLAVNFDLSQTEIASRVGKGRTTVTNALRLLRLPEEIQDLLREGRLSAGQARPLLGLPDKDRQIELARRAVEESLTARDLEDLVSPRKPEARTAGTKKKDDVDVHTRAAMEKLTQNLQTRVEIVRRRQGGQVRIFFHSEEELIRLYDRLMQEDDE